MQQSSCSPPLQGGARGGRRVLHDFREMVLEMNAAKTTEKSARSLMNDLQAKRFASRAQANRDEQTEPIAQAIRHDETIEPLTETIALQPILLTFGMR